METSILSDIDNTTTIKRHGYYYLQSRYYNPEWGRYINADSYVSTGQDMSSHNMYAYCENNPISRVDPQGEFWMIAAGVIGGVVNSAAQITSNVISGNKWYDAIGGAFAGGFTTGFLLTTTLNPIIAFGAGSLVESTFDETYDYVTKKKAFNAKNTAKSVMDIEWNTIGGGALGKLTGEVAGKMVKINPG
ncbi:MAG: hypothetical protein FWF46_08130, partial [Oscillospiraceae bacterium]|nr:hypothetical protein [Oscillospiraceae bacterium]